jgi:hypothetical protein
VGAKVEPAVLERIIQRDLHHIELALKWLVGIDEIYNPSTVQPYVSNSTETHPGDWCLFSMIANITYKDPMARDREAKLLAETDLGSIFKKIDQRKTQLLLAQAEVMVEQLK